MLLCIVTRRFSTPRVAALHAMQCSASSLTSPTESNSLPSDSSPTKVSPWKRGFQFRPFTMNTYGAYGPEAKKTVGQFFEIRATQFNRLHHASATSSKRLAFRTLLLQPRKYQPAVGISFAQYIFPPLRPASLLDDRLVEQRPFSIKMVIAIQTVLSLGHSQIPKLTLKTLTFLAQTHTTASR